MESNIPEHEKLLPEKKGPVAIAYELQQKRTAEQIENTASCVLILICGLEVLYAIALYTKTHWIMLRKFLTFHTHTQIEADYDEKKNKVCYEMAQRFMLVMAVVVATNGVNFVQTLGIATGYIRLIKENGELNKKVNDRIKYVNTVLGLVSFVFVIMYIYEGWTNDTSGVGIDAFHEKCTDQALGGWAYGFLIFYTACFCLVGTLIVCTFCCLCMLFSGAFAG